ncbi:hypothetical protein RF55_14027 [Lasius niger]|uniref:Integrase catalytic domain-containing protein n=1 Tax=Lasius niger TaxID=67767 RepID=A0A0J7K9A8_LASNI|nr:hypothetical protein RF55_14027 [Lasius niger]
MDHPSELINPFGYPCLRPMCSLATAEQQMGQLPTERTRTSRSFQSYGVDYAGSVLLCTTKGRGHKTIEGYICLFVCLSFKAVHIETVSDLTPSSFLAAFRRFTSQRGHCQLLLSNNGTNFRGAAKELRSMFRAASTFYQECIASLANDGTDSTYIPPGAPHFGGIWEAGVKSVKFHLRRVIGEHKLTFEEITTLLAQIEACLNSRPLYALSNSPTDLTALTPGQSINRRTVDEPTGILPQGCQRELLVIPLGTNLCHARLFLAEMVHTRLPDCRRNSMLTACGGDRLDRRRIAHTKAIGPIQPIPTTCCKHVVAFAIWQPWVHRVHPSAEKTENS